MNQPPCNRRLTRLVAVLLLALPSGAVAAAAAEDRVKAAVVHKITKFVTWPAGSGSAETRMRFCVAGDAGVLGALRKLAERPVHGRAILVRAAPGPAALGTECDVLYLGRKETRRADEWLAHVASMPVLTFGEADELEASASIVTISITRKKVRFAINLEAGNRAGLAIGAQLLQLAALVGDRER